mmetsp:Transcript_2364/g.6234  ORF Transcript_2364/g.6234 Transcript_2364/m.6234 type:complete len:185 (+) Transcript_2364:122-676(+)|eukprot:CAMPEP_0119572634 /NCGR_PEP_ID=MMETSP1352-20130426/44716_1 /TAXON_ID=265584 /ORGANISM="Stauroneis constricta, Strain CCMP1120" /LENGTH=184 /DNA_ID=CAMNT_0007622319 /DNA_START=274 /DNA_END=828 /DNA_ORIENTATION=+
MTSNDGKKMSSQMEAVVRLLSGQEERTIAQKLADSNRPTWEQYKKDNEDKLNLDGLDQRKMEEYRAQLDKERDTILARGKNNRGSKKKKKKKRRRDDDDDDSSDSDDSDSEDSRRRRRRRKKKKSKKRKHGSDSDDSSDDSSRRHKKRKSKKKKKKSRKSDDASDDGSAYRLSKFFDNDASDDE